MMNRNLGLSLGALASVGLALANCPGPVGPVWNPNEGKCVQGYLTKYCQDTELKQDGSCSGDSQPNVCFVSSLPLYADKHVYVPMYSGQCSIAPDNSNPCVDVTAPPITRIQYHIVGTSLDNC